MDVRDKGEDAPLNVAPNILVCVLSRKIKDKLLWATTGTRSGGGQSEATLTFGDPNLSVGRGRRILNPREERRAKRGSATTRKPVVAENGPRRSRN